MAEPHDFCKLPACLCAPAAPAAVAAVAADHAADPDAEDIPPTLPCGAPNPAYEAAQQDQAGPAPPVAAPPPVCVYGRGAVCHDPPLNGAQHETVKLLLLGHFGATEFGAPDFNKVNQTDKYDPLDLTDQMIAGNEAEIRKIRRRMIRWDAQLPDAAAAAPWRVWAAPAPAAPPAAIPAFAGAASGAGRNRDGVLIVSSGRGAALAEAMPHMPIIIWSIAKGHAIDIFVDPREFRDYRAAVMADETVAELAHALEETVLARGAAFSAPGVAAAQARLAPNTVPTETDLVRASLSLVTFAMPGPPPSIPAGFGFNRHLAFRYMCQNFRNAAPNAARCLMMDDNVAGFGGGEYALMDRFFGANFPAPIPAAPAEPWLCAVFKPCTAAPAMRKGLYDSMPMAAGAAAAPHAAQLSAGTDLFIQQMTLWNVGAARLATGEGAGLNYDPYFVTGKEDVSLDARLKHAMQARMHEDKSAQIRKVALTNTPPTDGVNAKNDATTEALVDTAVDLCPCHPIRPKGAAASYARTSCVTQTLALADRYDLRGKADEIRALMTAEAAPAAAAPASPAERAFDALVAVLTRRQNLVLEQIFAKWIAANPQRDPRA